MKLPLDANQNSQNAVCRNMINQLQQNIPVIYVAYPKECLHHISYCLWTINLEKGSTDLQSDHSCSKLHVKDSWNPLEEPSGNAQWIHSSPLILSLSQFLKTIQVCYIHMHKLEVSQISAPNTGKKKFKQTADKAQKKYWKLQHSPKNKDDYVVTSDAELDAKLVINLWTMRRVIMNWWLECEYMKMAHSPCQ